MSEPFSTILLVTIPEIGALTKLIDRLSPSLSRPSQAIVMASRRIRFKALPSQSFLLLTGV